MITTFFKTKIYKKHRERILLAIDLVIVFISFLIAGWLKNDLQFYLPIPDTGRRISLVVCAIVIYCFYFYVFKIYKSPWKYISIDELIRLALADALSVVSLIIVSMLHTASTALLTTEIIAGSFSFLLMGLFRALYRIIRRIEKGHQTGRTEKRVVIIGAGGAGNLLLKEIEQNKKLNYAVIGFVDDTKKGMRIGGHEILGSTKDLKKLKDVYGLDGALIAISNISAKKRRELYETCLNSGLETKVMNFDVEDKRPGRNIVVDIKPEDLLGRGEIHLDQDEIRDYISGNIVAVTGAGGSIGSELCRQIVKFNPKKLVMVDISENYLYMLEQEFRRNIEHGKMSPDIEFESIIASIRDKDAIDAVFEKYRPKVVYHAAAHKHVPLMETRPMEAIKNNVFGTDNLIKLCIKHKVERFIMISTDKAVNPTNVMGASKRMTEMILQANGHNGVTKMAAVRFGNVLGSNGSVIPIFKEQIKEGGPVIITDKNIVRYFMTISEAAQLVLQAGSYAECGDIFVLDMGEPVKIIDLAEKMIRLAGLEPYKDIEIKEIGLRPGEKMFEEICLNDEKTTKTKNNLIYKNAAMEITLASIEQDLKSLKSLVENNGTEDEQLRRVLLSMIISDDEATA